MGIGVSAYTVANLVYWLRCARFPEFLQNFSERQILWRMCLVDFHASTLKLPIQTSLSVAPTRCFLAQQPISERAHP